METSPRLAHPSTSHARYYCESKSKPPGGFIAPSTSTETGHLWYDPARIDARERPGDIQVRWRPRKKRRRVSLFTLGVDLQSHRQGRI